MALKDSEKTKNYTDNQKLNNPYMKIDERLNNKISNLVQRVAMHSRSESEEHFDHLIQHTIDLTTDSKNSNKELFRMGSNKRPFQFEFVQSYKEIIREKFQEPHRAETKVAWKYLPTRYNSTTLSYMHHLQTTALTAPDLDTPSEYYKTINMPTTTKGNDNTIATDKWHDNRDNVFVMFARHILCHSATIVPWKALYDVFQSYNHFLIQVLHSNPDIAEELGKPITDVFMDSANMVSRWSERAARGNLTHYCDMLLKRHVRNWDLNPILDLYSLFMDKDTQPWVKQVTSAYLEYPVAVYVHYKDLHEIISGLFREVSIAIEWQLRHRIIRAFVKPLRRQYNLSKKEHAPNGFYYMRMKRLAFLLNRYAYYNGYPTYALLYRMELEKSNRNVFLKYGFHVLPETWLTRSFYLGPSTLSETYTGLMQYRALTPIRQQKKNNTKTKITYQQPQVYLDKDDQMHSKLKIKVQTEIMPEAAMNFSAEIHSFNPKIIETNSEIYQTNQSTSLYKRKTLQTLQKYTDKLPTNNEDDKKYKLTENQNDFDTTQQMKIYKSNEHQKYSYIPTENRSHYQKRVVTREYRDRQNISGSVQKYPTVHRRKKRKRSSTHGRTTDIFKKVRQRIDNSDVQLSQNNKKQANNRPNIDNENSWRRKFKSFFKKSRIVQKLIDYSKRKNLTRVGEAI